MRNLILATLGLMGSAYARMGSADTVGSPTAGVTNAELREDGATELREDGSYEERE